jgi:hypothetical protein
MFEDRPEEIDKWLREHWPDRAFEASDALRGDYSGTYTLYCSLVQRHAKDYILKRYSPLGGLGVQAEKLNYGLFRDHLLFPRLEAFLPKGTDWLGSMSYGVLISYYPRKVAPAGISMVEVLAIGLSMATMFSYFAEQDRIYFDLRSDSLRIDSEGGLHLIDFSDLVTIKELLSRDHSGLPVVDRESKLIPPEGRRYQDALSEYRNGPINGDDTLSWSAVRKLAYAIHPEEYQVFSLAGLIIELLVGPRADDASLKDRISRACASNDGAFSAEECARLLDLLTSMHDPHDVDRPSFTTVRKVFWSLLGPRLKPEFIASSLVSRRAAELLRTISRRDGDSTSSQIHESLIVYWSITDEASEL